MNSNGLYHIRVRVSSDDKNYLATASLPAVRVAFTSSTVHVLCHFFFLLLFPSVSPANEEDDVVVRL